MDTSRGDATKRQKDNKTKGLRGTLRNSQIMCLPVSTSVYCVLDTRKIRNEKSQKRTGWLQYKRINGGLESRVDTIEW